MTTVAAIDAEIGIGGEDDGVGQGFAHPHEAGIGKTHGDVGVLLHKIQDPVQLIGEVKGGDHGAAAKKRGEARSAPSPEKVEGLRKDRFARLPGRGQTRGLGRRPWVMAVAAAQKGDQKAGVNERASGHSPWSSSRLSSAH